MSHCENQNSDEFGLLHDVMGRIMCECKDDVGGVNVMFSMQGFFFSFCTFWYLFCVICLEK